MALKRMSAAVFAALVLVPFPSAQADDTGFASIHDWRREGRKTCFTDHFHSGTGYAKSKKAALRQAIISWSSFTATEYGSDWARWRLASSKGKRCDRTGGGWDCYVEARPCARGRR